MDLKKILVVDDEPGMVLILTQVLIMAGYAAEGVSDGESGWQRFQEEPWDLVISDWTMLNFDGAELARRIHERNPETPMMIVTGFPQAVTKKERFATVVMKPFNRATLLDELEKIFPATA